MSNFEGATLVPWQVCKSALESFNTARDEFMAEWDAIKARLKTETTVSRVWFVFACKETKWDAVCRWAHGNYHLPERGMYRLGFITEQQYDDWQYFDGSGYYAAKSIKQLTNNGTRDAYLNPERAAFVNRWSK